MSESLLHTDDLTKKFGEFTAVDHVNFSIDRGAVEALIGPNGAGKTTFQNLITGNLAPTEGTVHFDGRDITADEPYQRARRGIIRKYQVTSIYESQPVMENVQLAVRGQITSAKKLLTTHGNKDIRDRVDELLSIAGLDDKATEVAGNLSYGEQQWLEIAMSLGADPDLLLLDEPTSGMSRGETNETVELIAEIQNKRDVSILVIEHDMDFIKDVSESITVLHQGAIIAEGNAAEIKSNETVKEVYLGDS